MTGFRDRIVSDPNICFGKACIKGTRIWVSLVLDFLAEDVAEAEILKMYPQLEHDDIRAVIAYAAELARETITTAAE